MNHALKSASVHKYYAPGPAQPPQTRRSGNARQLQITFGTFEIRHQHLFCGGKRKAQKSLALGLRKIKKPVRHAQKRPGRAKYYFTPDVDKKIRAADAQSVAVRDGMHARL